MLVLSRRIGEEVRIGSEITVRVVNIRGRQVVLGFDVPREIKVLRTELEPGARAVAK